MVLNLGDDPATLSCADAELAHERREVAVDGPSTAHRTSPTTAATAPEKALQSLRPRSSLLRPRRVSR